MTSKEKLSPERVLRRAFWTMKVPSIATMVLVPVIIVFVLRAVAQNHPDVESIDPIWAYTRVADIDTLHLQTTPVTLLASARPRRTLGFKLA